MAPMRSFDSYSSRVKWPLLFTGRVSFQKMLYVGKTGGLDDVALREALLTALDQLGELRIERNPCTSFSFL